MIQAQNLVVTEKFCRTGDADCHRAAKGGKIVLFRRMLEK